MNEEMCLDHLRKALSAYGVDSEPEFGKVTKYCRHVVFGQGEYLHEPGQVASDVFFLCNGMVRFFYLTEDGKEHNKSFAVENQFAGAAQNINHPVSARYFIQAMEPVTALAISLKGLEALYTGSLAWANLGRLYMESLVVKKVNRESEFLLDSAEQRYLRLLAEQPRLAERLPLYHIASYLGITDVALSRIRRRLQEN
jgi:CRP-like cAMP-binding protein